MVMPDALSEFQVLKDSTEVFKFGKLVIVIYLPVLSEFSEAGEESKAVKEEFSLKEITCDFCRSTFSNKRTLRTHIHCHLDAISRKKSTKLASQIASTSGVGVRIGKRLET